MKKAKKKAAKTVDMTIRDFQAAIGLDKDPVGYVATAAVLRALVQKGIVVEAARIHFGTDKSGRKTVIYRVPVNLVLKTAA